VRTGREAAKNNVTLREFSQAICVSERSFFYWSSGGPTAPTDMSASKRAAPPNKLKPEETKAIVEVLRRTDWAEFSPREIYYKLLDEDGIILASVSSFYRIARKENLLATRLRPESTGQKLNRETPHLVATGPNQIWSWDVSQIRSHDRTIRFYLYVIMDIWSRYVVGWRLQDHEESIHAIDMWKQALEAQSISGNGLTNHKDNGSIMTANEMIKFVRDAKMIDSYSRAGVSDDNPFSEALFRTIKYFRNYPDSFVGLTEGRNYFGKYFQDYNDEFRHSGIQFLSPSERHYGQEAKILAERNRVIEATYLDSRHRYSSEAKTFKPIIEVKIN
jgi:putative transposase